MKKKIIKRPFITEKTLSLANQGFYTFVVEAEARKEQIAKSVEEVYGVKVIDVHTILMPGKFRRAGRKMMRVKKPDWKKAIVKLVKGQTIEAFTVTHEGQTSK